MNIKHPRRILVIGSPGSGTLGVIEDLTGTAPKPHENGSTAGLSHEWDIKTAYYEAKVPLWVDEMTDIAAWKAEFLKSEAKEVVEAIGAWVYCFKITEKESVSEEWKEVMDAVQQITEEHAGYGADTVTLAVAMPDKAGANHGLEEKRDEWDDVCLQYGFEFIDYAAHGKNEFGENTGFDRVKEALEANEWAATPSPDEDELDIEDLDFDDEDDIHGFARDEAEMTAELFGMKAALAGDSFEPDAEDLIPPNQQESQVENLDRLMGKLLAVKEQSADLPEAQRKKMAAKAVRELLSGNGG